MKISDQIKARYVFGELRLKEVIDIAWGSLGLIVVHQDGCTWEHCYWDRQGGKLNIYDGDENCDEENPLWVFSMKEKVRVEKNMVHFKNPKLARHQTAIELMKKTKFDIEKAFQRT